MRARGQEQQSQNNAVCDSAAKSFLQFLSCKNVDSVPHFSIEKSVENLSKICFPLQNVFLEKFVLLTNTLLISADSFSIP